MLLGAVHLLPLGKEQCFQDEVTEHPLAQLSSAGLCACPSAFHPGAPCPSLCIKRSTLPGEEANRPNKSLLQAPLLGHSVLPSPSGPRRAGPSEGLPRFLP